MAESIFPEVQVVRTPRVVTAICGCLGDIGAKLSFLPSTPLASHGDNFNKTDVRDEANHVAN